MTTPQTNQNKTKKMCSYQQLYISNNTNSEMTVIHRHMHTWARVVVLSGQSAHHHSTVPPRGLWLESRFRFYSSAVKGRYASRPIHLNHIWNVLYYHTEKLHLQREARLKMHVIHDMFWFFLLELQHNKEQCNVHCRPQTHLNLNQYKISVLLQLHDSVLYNVFNSVTAWYLIPQPLPPLLAVLLSTFSNIIIINRPIPTQTSAPEVLF